MDLFDDLPPPPNAVHTPIAPGAVLLRGFAREGDVALLQAVEAVIHQAPLRHMQTPGGYTMSVATTSGCGWCMETWSCGVGHCAWPTTA